MALAHSSSSSRLVPTALRLLSVCRMSATRAPVSLARDTSVALRISIMAMPPPDAVPGAGVGWPRGDDVHETATRVVEDGEPAACFGGGRAWMRPPRRGK